MDILKLAYIVFFMQLTEWTEQIAQKSVINIKLC